MRFVDRIVLAVLIAALAGCGNEMVATLPPASATPVTPTTPTAPTTPTTPPATDPSAPTPPTTPPTTPADPTPPPTTPTEPPTTTTPTEPTNPTQPTDPPTTPTDPPSTPTDPPATPQPNAGCVGDVATGQGAFTDYTKQSNGACRKLTAADLPTPNLSSSVTNYSTLVARKDTQFPQVPEGFKVEVYASGLTNPRLLAIAPNGDTFVAQPGSGNIVVLRGLDATGKAQSVFTFASGQNSPYGLAFYPLGNSPQYLYVANAGSIVRFPYKIGDTQATANATTIATLPNNGGHTTRTLAFTTDNRLLVSVGSATNVTNTDTDKSETNRADVLAYTPDGTFLKIFASGLRNAVGLTLDPSGTPWVSVNERDGLGDNLPPDYVTHIQEDGFYGWPWYYIGANPDPRLPVAHPDLASKTIVPDTLLQPHFAPLQIAFYTGTMFPAIYKGDLFVAIHGSWNKSVRGGYELARVLQEDGNATGVYQDFMTGFVNADGTVWGRPAGVAMASDGSLLVADDGSNTIWRITYPAK